MHVVDADNEKESLLGDEGCDNAAKTARTASCPARAKSWFQRSRLLAALDIFLLLAIAYYIFAPVGSSPARPRRRHPPRHRHKALMPVASGVEVEVEEAGLANASGLPAGKRQKRKGGKKQAAAAAAADEACGRTSQPFQCAANPKRAVVTLSLGKRTHFAVTRVALAAYAKRVGAELHVIDSNAHPSLAKWNATLAARSASNHFIKLPMFEWFLDQFDQVLFMDDDVLVSPYAPDLFAKVPCQSGRLGAVVEAYHKQGWHAMHGRATCELYNLAAEVPGSCTKHATKKMRIFNSGVMLMSAAHRPLLAGWEKSKLECRILCDQLYLNAMMIKHGICLQDLGTPFNLPGTQVRKLLMATAKAPAPASGLQGTAIADACMVHLTVLPSKHYTSHYLLKRSLEDRDVMLCTHDGPVRVDRGAMVAALPGEEQLQGVSSYDITKIWCKGYGDSCQLIPPPGGAAALAAAAAVGMAAAAVLDDGPIRPPLGSVDEEELPGPAQTLMARTAARAWDRRTVILLFATADFMDLAINWAQAATLIGVTNFVLVCMDKELAHSFDGFDVAPHTPNPHP